MTDNTVTTHDKAVEAMQQASKMVAFQHKGAAGSTGLHFGVAKQTASEEQKSSTSAMVGDGAWGEGSSAGSGHDDTTSSSGSGSDNAFTTHDKASEASEHFQKMIHFTHEGAAGSTDLSYGVEKQTHHEMQESSTSAMFDDLGAWGGSQSEGSGSEGAWGSGSGSGDQSGGNNMFTTHDKAVSFDSEMMKAFDFNHEGAAGSTSLGFETSKATHWASQESSTSSMFDDGIFGQMDSGIGHGSAHSLIG
ncbi:hypothetical protein [uncultured Alsobacter sp.]|uniref:hypothetical protein n=1 Tax=uncultured Alsobacter sp. TaxID=1748258 RepID=UPI0025E71B2A|nr:hypothetical protein [uncultured Alsobacter sp.]